MNAMNAMNETGPMTSEITNRITNQTTSARLPVPGWLQPLHGLLAPLSIDREVSVGGAYVPTLMILAVVCALLTWGLDALLARVGAYTYIWHPPLFRVSLFCCLLAAVGLAFYG